MEQCPELPEDIWEMIFDNLKLICHCVGIRWSAGNDIVLPLPPYSQIKFVNKLFYSKLYFPPSSLINPYIPLPECPPLIAIRYHDLKINIEIASPSEDENS